MLTASKAGRYELLGELGHGGMGVVYRAKDPLIGRIVALKTLRLSEEGTGMSHTQLVERFQNESRAAGILTHPNIVAIYDAGESDGLCYIALELINGKSIQSLLDSGEKFSVPRLLNIMEQVCSALEYAHHQSVVHRDIKPANIMLTAGDGVKITDFGTAKIMQYGAAKQSAVMGTPGYMSPEQIKGYAIDGRTDIFSLGVMLYEMTTGKQPFRGKDIPSILFSVLNHEPQTPNELNPSIPIGVSSTIMKALSKSPHLRYDSCTDLLEDLKNYRPGENGRPSTAPSPTAKRLTSPPPVTPSKDAKEKSFNVQMPQIPGVTPRPASAAPPRPAPKPAPPPTPAPASTFNTDSHEDSSGHIPGTYAGPPSKLNVDSDSLKRYARIGVGVLLGLWLVSFALKTFTHRSNTDATLEPPPAAMPASSSTDAAPGDVSTPLYVSATSPQVATLADLAQPWSSKSFIFFSATQGRNVPALLIRLPGPASQSSSYWAFSLEAPYNQCQLEYIQELAKLSHEYGFPARHPMVVNPCSHAVFDPLQLKEIPGNIIVRGAVVKGSDLRPPFGIEVKVSSNQILATAME